MSALRSSSGSGGGFGLWAIPRVGSIVAVLVPDGQIEFEPVIVGVLDNNAAPDGLDETLTLLADDRPVAIRAPKVQLGDSDASEAFIKGTSYRRDEDTMIANLVTAFGALATASTGPLAPLSTGFAAVGTALTTFQGSATSAAAYLSTVVLGK